jgi:hypothetical protein
MEASDPDLAFAASLLSYACKNGGLTDRQERYAVNIIDRLYNLWQSGELPSQRRKRATETPAPALNGRTVH